MEILYFRYPVTSSERKLSILDFEISDPLYLLVRKGVGLRHIVQIQAKSQWTNGDSGPGWNLALDLAGVQCVLEIVIRDLISPVFYSPSAHFVASLGIFLFL